MTATVAAPATEDQGPTATPDPGEKRRLTTIGGLAALSLDAMASVAYGPEAIVLVLAAAGSHGLGFTVPVSAAIVALLAILIISYRQLIEAFPNGGGAYAVARKYLGDRTALVAAGSLVIDYVLNVAVSVAAGTAALTSAIPATRDHTLPIALAIVVLITAVNLRGLVTSARLFIVPTAIFVFSLVVVIISGLLGHSRLIEPTLPSSDVVSTVGVLLLLKAFASGCSALTGVEAIANATPQFRKNRVKRAQRAEVSLGVILGTLMIGIAILIEKFDIHPRDGVTVLSQVTEGAVGRGVAYYIVQFSTVILLALAANTSFGGLPQLMKVVASDDYMPHRLTRRSRTGVYREGVLLLGGIAAVLLLIADGNMNYLVPLFAIGVFIGFTIAQVGLVRHWSAVRTHNWRIKLSINAFGALCTGVAAVVVLAMKATEGGALVPVMLALLVAGMWWCRRYYAAVDKRECGSTELASPARSRPHLSALGVVVVAVSEPAALSRDTIRRVGAFGREVRAVHVFSPNDDRELYHRQWREMHPTVAVVELAVGDEEDSFVDPIVHYVQELGASDDVIVVVPDEGSAVARALCAGRSHDLELAIIRRTKALVARVPSVSRAASTTAPLSR